MIKSIPSDVVEFWTVNQKKLVLEGIFCLDFITDGRKAPRLFQLQAMLAVLEKRDLVVKAGTGYGKTLCMVLPLLVRRDGVAIMVTPQKLLQKKHVRRQLVPSISC
jgi:ATP-dependent helicase YprA (DUF1998 family)